MKEITSIKTGKIQIISEETWDEIIGRGWAKRFTVSEVTERKLRDVPKIIPAEVKTKTKKI